MEEREEETKKEMSRKEKRKAMKKMKRKQIRKEMAEKERQEEEARLNDPEEQRRMQLMEQQEAERIQRDIKEFEERERAWMENMKMIKEQEEERTAKLLQQSESKTDGDAAAAADDDQYEYVDEEGPPQIIWQGNEIIVKKKKVRVRVTVPPPNKEHEEQELEQEHHQEQDADNRPTSNPFPPQSPPQQLLDNVAQQIPNFGTEQDKAHCPFHLKTGACRFGQRCSRVHLYPDKSCTFLIKNMYNGPGLSWEQDDGLECTDEEVERCFEEFYEDVHTEFLKFGEIVNFKVCKNGSYHLRGNVYVQYKSLDSALLAYNSVNGRYFAGKQVSCTFVNLTRWKVAICGEYMKSGFKTCCRGTACNFIHCFRNPGGDYEWANLDKRPPKHWVKKMVALFGYSDDYETSREEGNLSVLKNSSNMSIADSDRYHSRRSRSRNMDRLNSGRYGRSKHEDERMQRTPDEEWNANFKDNRKRKWRGRTPDTDKEEDSEKYHDHARKSSFNRNKDDIGRSLQEDSDLDCATITRKQHGRREGRNSRKWNRDRSDWIYEAGLDEDIDRERRNIGQRKSSRHQSRDNSNVIGESESEKDLLDRGDMEAQHDGSRKSLRLRRSGLQEDYKDYENENDNVDGGWSRWKSDRRAYHRKKKSLKNQKKSDSINGDTKNASQESSGEWYGKELKRG
ncbi:zinc finger CCCH domain-containing protein 5 [Gastrolobium bilobum]|uniref:zinc finger CCCH domain-containing protein 5 n=1 Tax=Gastrolobium bilobum TaxID=150636 RepID=UPI002AB04675|nr:zinc finger CCCH domain-containing protein 5 [Gastrolobium bilobum]